MLHQATLEVVGVSDIAGAISALENVHPENHDQGRYTNGGASTSARSPFDKLRVSGVEIRCHIYAGEHLGRGLNLGHYLSRVCLLPWVAVCVSMPGVERRKGAEWP